MPPRQSSLALRLLQDPLALTELFAIANLAFLAVDIYVAHSMNEFAHPAEWIPFGFSLAAPPLLIAAMFAQRSFRPVVSGTGSPEQAPHAAAARRGGIFVGAASVLVGIAGLFWHLESVFFHERTLRHLVYTAPFAAPLAYTGLGLLLLLNRLQRADSREWAQWVLVLALGGFIGNFFLSAADHAQNGFFEWTEWIPVISSALAIGVLLGAIWQAGNRPFLKLSMGTMLLQIVVALLGWVLHLQAVFQSPMESPWERVVYGAPIFAPLLFADLALLGMIGLLALLQQREVVAPEFALATD